MVISTLSHTNIDQKMHLGGFKKSIAKLQLHVIYNKRSKNINTSDENISAMMLNITFTSKANLKEVASVAGLL